MADEQLLQGMIIRFMEKQTSFNERIIESMAKSESQNRLFYSIMMVIISGVVSATIKYLLP